MRIVKLLDKIERVLIFVLFATMVLAVFFQVANRNFFKLNISWFEEVARGCMVYVLMFATEIGLRDHSQLNVDSLIRRVPPNVAMIFEKVSSVATIVFSGLVGITSIKLLIKQYEVGAISPGLGLPTYYAQASVTIGCLIICFTQCVYLLNALLKKKAKEGEGK